MPTPPQEVIDAFIAPTTKHTRRVEVYEQDGITRWDTITPVKLKEGSVSVDYSRAERRSLDLVLDNSEKDVISGPGKFWYDKIIKVFRGVVVESASGSYTWETQIGEFMIDRINDSSFPHTVKVTGRDYTKKCLQSKFAYATQFATGLSLESIIGNIASNAGITKRNLPATGITVNRTFFYERGVTRWDAMKEIADSYNYEIFFDPYGYLTMRLFNDPALSSPTITIHPGENGQLSSWEKSTSDSRMYNHVIVTGESSDASAFPASGEAVNTDPLSPTSVAEIGDRLYQFVSSFITTDTQAQAVADKFLAIHSLEEFEISYQSLMLPWLEAGDIMSFVDSVEDVDNGGDPTTFLLSSLTIPLQLGPMASVGKRVTIVG